MTEDQEKAIDEYEPELEEELTGQRAFAEALWGAQKDAPRIIKADDKHYDGYHYASETTYQRLLVPILLDWGLVATLDAVGPPEDLELETRGGGIQWMTTIECIFRVTHGPTGHSEVYRIRGRRSNDKDKGVQHAITSASKVFWQRLLQVSESEEAPSNPVQESQTSRPPKHGGRAPRKPQGQSRPPSEKPPPPVGNDLSPETRLSLAKESIRALLARNHQRVYHLEALTQCVPDLPDLLEEWGLQDYELVGKILEEDPNQCERAMGEMAKKEPTDKARTQKLHDLQRKLIEQGEGSCSSEEQILTAAAIGSKWSDAVEFWIDKYADRLKGQQELDT